MKILLALIPLFSFAQGFSSPSDQFEMTDLTRREAKEVFQSINTNTKSKAQCYNKAYVWSYYMKQNYNIDSNKLFIFYTSKYLRELGGEWSYHVAPLVKVEGEKAVFDKTFWHSSYRTLSIQSWVDILMAQDNRSLDAMRRKLRTQHKILSRKMRNSRYDYIEKQSFQKEIDEIENQLKNALITIDDKVQIKCPIVKNISEVENNKAQESEYCYLLESSMYYKDPVDLRYFEGSNLFMTEFNAYDLKKAKRQAFNNWRDLE